MTIDGDVLEIELDMELDDVCELKEFVSTRLKYIEEIAIVGGVKEFATSALFSLLFAIKKTKPSIKIPLLDEGEFSLENFGKLYWKA
jgi:hypothetical protein